MNWKNKNVFVTGGDGFIGSHLALALAKKRANVFILVKDNRLKKASFRVLDVARHVSLLYGNLINYPLVEDIIRNNKIEAVFHLAAQALVGMASSKPKRTFEWNVRGTWNVLEACRRAGGVKRVVVASSDKAYGVQKELPYTERSPLNGLYPYDASKACADIIARSYFTSFGLPVAVTRKANVYGGGDLNFSRLIPDTIRSILKGKEFVIRSDGTPERDYLYVGDAVRAYLVMAEKIKKTQGQAFNFGWSKPISVLDLYKKIYKLSGKPYQPPKITGRARNEIDRQYLDSTKARRVLRWRPRVSLNRGLKKTIEWYRSYL